MIERLRNFLSRFPWIGRSDKDDDADASAKSLFGGRKTDVERGSDDAVFDSNADAAYYGGMNNFANWWARKFDFGSWERRATFHGNIAMHVAKEHAVTTILKEWRERYEKRGDMRAAALGRMIDRMEGGAHVEVAMGEYMPPMERVMVMVGRETGRLDIGFAQAQFVAESVGKLKSVIRLGLAYPAFIFVLIGVMLAMVSFMLVPVLEALLPVPKWPLVSKALYWTAFAVRKFSIPFLIALALSIFAMRWVLPNWTGMGRGFADRWVPFFTLYRENMSSTFLIAVASLIQSGQSFSGSISKIAELGTPWLKWHIEKMQVALAEGTPPAGSIDTGMLPTEVIDTIAVYQAANQLEEGLVDIGKTTIEKATKRIELIVAVFRTLGLLFVGGMLLLMVVGTLWVASAMIREYRLPIGI